MDFQLKRGIGDFPAYYAVTKIVPASQRIKVLTQSNYIPTFISDGGKCERRYMKNNPHNGD